MIGPTREQMSKERRVERKFKQTGLDKNDIVDTVRKRLQVKRLQVK